MVNHYDYVIVGSGIAGLYAALLAREHGSVLVLTKSSIDECNTRYAQGGIVASGDIAWGSIVGYAWDAAWAATMRAPRSGPLTIQTASILGDCHRTGLIEINCH